MTILRKNSATAVILTSVVTEAGISKLKDLPVHIFNGFSDRFGPVTTSVHNLKLFVAYRAVEIEEGLSNADWNFIPQFKNPADLAMEKYWNHKKILHLFGRELLQSAIVDNILQWTIRFINVSYVGGKNSANSWRSNWKARDRLLSI